MKRLLLALCAFAAFPSCSNPRGPAEQGPPLPESFWLGAPPAAVTSIPEAKTASASKGEIALLGRVKDFTPGLAAFTITDPKLKACNEAGPMDTCPTPWDYCCDDPKEVAAVSATVEFRDGAAVLKANPKGFHGLDHLKTVVVVGNYEKDAAGNLTVIARSMHVKP